MRVLITGFTANRGGVETFVFETVRAICRQDPEARFDLVSFASRPAFARQFEELGGRVYTLPAPRQKGARRAMEAFFAAHAGGYDLLWCNKCDLSNLDFLRLAEKYAIPCRLLHSHAGHSLHHGLRRFAFGALHRLHRRQGARLATRLWACSDRAAHWMFGKKAVEQGRVDYIPNAVDLDAFAPNLLLRQQCRREQGWQGRTVYGFVGRLIPAKNPLFALRAFAALSARQPQAVLAVVGEGSLEPRLRRLAARLGCADRVQFLGMRGDVPRLLQGMDCLWMPSVTEGFPVAAVEAQAAGLPVFVSREGVTAQAGLTGQLHFLPLRRGPAAWAREVQRTDLARRDCRQLLEQRGFDLPGAARALWKAMEEMVREEKERARCCERKSCCL